MGNTMTDDYRFGNSQNRGAAIIFEVKTIEEFVIYDFSAA